MFRNIAFWKDFSIFFPEVDRIMSIILLPVFIGLLIYLSTNMGGMAEILICDPLIQSSETDKSGMLRGKFKIKC